VFGSNPPTLSLPIQISNSVPSHTLSGPCTPLQTIFVSGSAIVPIFSSDAYSFPFFTTPRGANTSISSVTVSIPNNFYQLAYWTATGMNYSSSGTFSCDSIPIINCAPSIPSNAYFVTGVKHILFEAFQFFVVQSGATLTFNCSRTSVSTIYVQAGGTVYDLQSKSTSNPIFAESGATVYSGNIASNSNSQELTFRSIDHYPSWC
jgi:hypothetical protein